MIKYDSVQVIAKNNTGDVACLVRYGKIWRYTVEYKGQDLFTTGVDGKTKKQMLDNARPFLLSSLCGCFVEDDILLPDVDFLTTDQRVAINNAIRILGQSNSDYAEQSTFFLKQLVK